MPQRTCTAGWLAATAEMSMTCWLQCDSEMAVAPALSHTRVQFVPSLETSIQALSKSPPSTPSQRMKRRVTNQAPEQTIGSVVR